MATLTLGETKGVCSIAYDGVKGERYRFPDGSIWKIAEHWATTISGFKGIITMPETRSDVYVMAFAGTDSMLDGLVDLVQLTGGIPAQYTQAIQWARMGYAAADSIFVLAGHSLGGGLASYCSVLLRCPAFTVNPAPLVGAATLSSFGKNVQITNYIARNEFVSSSPGRNPGTDVVVPSSGGTFSFFTDHMLANVAPSIPLPVKIVG
jgi:Protein of unknown function (DUF2974)